MLTEIDIDALTQFIQSSLASPELIDEELFRDEAVAYNDLCFELNSHLAQTDRLIDAGRRDEAIEYSERHGNLLTVFERLDLPERELWCELVDAFELPLPPDINVDAAEQLNDAYATIGNLSPLLRRHRLLALDRAPLRYRVETLAELARRDPLNPIWQGSATSLQQARLNQISAELSNAMSGDDASSIEELHDELKSTKWLVPIPAKLKTQIKTALQAAQRRTILAEIETLSQQLQQAQQDQQATVAIEIADQIGAKIAAADIQSDDPVLSPLGPMLTWVAGLRQQDEQRRRDDQAIAGFRTVLTRAKTPAELEAALESIRSMGSRFPADLRERGAKRLASLKQGVLIKRLIIIAGVVAVSLVSIAGIAGFVYFQHRQGQLAELDVAFGQLIADGRWDEAKTFYDSQIDAVKLRPAFSVGAEKVAEALKAERLRKETFDRIVAEIQSDESGTTTERLLDELRELAKTREDQNVIGRQETLAAHRRLMRERTNADQVQKSLEDLQRNRDRLMRSTPPDLAGLRVLQRRTEELRREASFAGAQTVERVDSFAKQIQDVITRVELAEKDSEIREAITQSVGDLESFASMLTEYAGEGCLPDDRPQWKDLAERLSQMREDAMWIEMLNDPVFQDPAGAGSKGLSDWTARFAKASESAVSKNHFLRAHMKDRVPDFEALREHENALKTLSDFAKSSLLETMYVYVDPDPSPDRFDEPPAVYYSPKSYESGDPRHKVNYFADYSLAIREQNFGAPKYAEMRGLESAHSMFGKWLRENLNQFKGKQFAPTGVRLLDYLAKMPEDRCDPIFKLSLIRNFMKVLVPASRPLASGYKEILSSLEASGMNWEANWFLPGNADSEVVLARQQATELLAGIDWESARRRTSETWKQVYGKSSWSVRWVGWWSHNGRESTAMLNKAMLDDIGDEDEIVLFRHYKGREDTVQPVTIGRGGRSRITINEANLRDATPGVYAIDRGKK